MFHNLQYNKKRKLFSAFFLSLFLLLVLSFKWCRERDLNPQTFRHEILNLACLPISPPRRFYKKQIFITILKPYHLKIKRAIVLNYCSFLDNFLFLESDNCSYQCRNYFRHSRYNQSDCHIHQKGSRFFNFSRIAGSCHKHIT